MLERVMTRETWIVIGAVALIVLLAGLYTVMGIGMSMSALDMTRMAGPVGEPMGMGPSVNWTWGYALLIFLMWWVMMIAVPPIKDGGRRSQPGAACAPR